MEDELKYVYHVSYVCQNNSSTHAFGSITMFRNHKIDSGDQVTSVANYIKETTGSKTVVILNFILLNEEGK